MARRRKGRALTRRYGRAHRRTITLTDRLDREEAYRIARAAHGDSSWVRDSVDEVLRRDPEIDAETLVRETAPV
jgi:hypothetical protein